MNIYIFASGSRGNSVILESESGNYLVIDLGISYKKFNEKLKEQKIDQGRVNNFIITHEHQDHIKGIKVFLKSGPKAKFFLTGGTYNQLLKQGIDLPKYEKVEYNKTFSIDDFNITPIETSHDASEPMGLIIETTKKKVALITDTGYIPSVYDEELKDLDCYLVEANHDIAMLMRSPRPQALKARIISEEGHLSNDYVTEKLDRLITKKSIWIVCHISEDCNSKDKIEEAICKNFSNPFKLSKVYYTSQKTLKVKI